MHKPVSITHSSVQSKCVKKYRYSAFQDSKKIQNFQKNCSNRNFLDEKLKYPIKKSWIISKTPMFFNEKVRVSSSIQNNWLVGIWIEYLSAI